MQEKSLIKQNILQFIDFKGITKYKFYQETGITRGILDQNNGMSEENTSKFLAYYPEVNVEWLLTGNGSMLKGEVNQPPIQEVQPSSNSEVEALLREKMAMLEKNNALLEENNAFQKEKIKQLEQEILALKKSGVTKNADKEVLQT